MAEKLAGRAEESLRGPLKVGIHDNMGDAFELAGQVPGEMHDQYPEYDMARHAVRAEAIRRIPEMLSLLDRGVEIVVRFEEIAELDELEHGFMREVRELFGELNRTGEETEREHPRESAEMRGEGVVDG